MSKVLRIGTTLLALAMAASLAGCGLFGSGNVGGPGKNYIEIPQNGTAPAAQVAPAPATK
jgi:hypothetical protein